MQVAIVGLGRVGGEFLEELLRHRDKGVVIRCVAELSDTPGRRLALAEGVRVVSLDDLIFEGEGLDIVFDLTGSRSVRRTLRERMEDTHNSHTVIAPETVSRFIWSLMTDRPLPDVHGDMGY